MRALVCPFWKPWRVASRCLTSTTGAAPEVSGGWAVTVNPYDVEAIADGIARALETPAPRLAQARAHARAFTWERCASQTLSIYRSVV